MSKALLRVEPEPKLPILPGRSTAVAATSYKLLVMSLERAKTDKRSAAHLRIVISGKCFRTYRYREPFLLKRETPMPSCSN